MPKLMEKRDWIQTVANVSSAERVWSENVLSHAGTVSLPVPEGGMYQVIFVKIDTKPESVMIDVLRGDTEFSVPSADALDAKMDEGLLIAPVTYVELAPSQEGQRSVKRNFPHYNLDVILAIGMRIRSDVAVRFRQRAIRHLHEFLDGHKRKLERKIYG